MLGYKGCKVAGEVYDHSGVYEGTIVKRVS
jgi:hypothetical protein